MPELPEVQTVVSDLKKHVTGFRIIKVEIASGYNVSPDKEEFERTLEKAHIATVQRVGKHIVIELDTGWFLTFHLAMTGRLLLRHLNAPPDAHQKVQLVLVKGKVVKLLRFCDMRVFGKAGTITKQGLAELKNKYGPDLYKDKITVETFAQRLKSKNTAIKHALLEQATVTGLGNIYVTEALWLAKMHPKTPARSLDLKSAHTLLVAIRRLLKEGVLHRGSTLADRAFVDILGRPGKQQEYLRIYGKKTCPACSSKVEYLKIHGRGTYFCPVCQK